MAQGTESGKRSTGEGCAGGGALLGVMLGVMLLGCGCAFPLVMGILILNSPPLLQERVDVGRVLPHLAVCLFMALAGIWLLAEMRGRLR